MLDPKMEAAINEQIKWELYSAYLYYSMAAYFDTLNLGGFSHWMLSQAQEEVTHAHRFFKYVSDRGGKVKLRPIEGPPSEWASPLKVFEDTYAHEVEVTSKINKLVDLSQSLSDHATYNFLQWFVAEQVEEEASADEVVQKLKLIGSSADGLFMLDLELAKRPILATMPQGE